MIIILLLSSLIFYSFVRKKGCKPDIVEFGDFYYTKIMFILLTKVITVYEQFFII